MFVAFSAQESSRTRTYFERGVEPANEIGYQGSIGRFMRIDQERSATDYGVIRLSGIARGPLCMDYTRNYLSRHSAQYADVESLLSDGWVVA